MASQPGDTGLAHYMSLEGMNVRDYCILLRRKLGIVDTGRSPKRGLSFGGSRPELPDALDV